MGVAWVVRDSLWNASCASAQRPKQVVKSWAERTLQVSSIDMSFAPPRIVAQVYNMSNWHWVLRLLLIAWQIYNTIFLILHLGQSEKSMKSSSEEPLYEYSYYVAT